MTLIYRLGAVLTTILLMSPAIGLAQDSGGDEAAVWAAVEAIWTAEERGDNDRVDDMLSEDFMGWPNSAPAPRGKDSTSMWREFNNDQQKGLVHELYPLSIIVHGDMAVAHYLYTNAVQTRDKKTETANGRYTDILIRDGSTWTFIAWLGGNNH
jgi:ketosteroid isomerase-like protein